MCTCKLSESPFPSAVYTDCRMFNTILLCTPYLSTVCIDCRMCSTPFCSVHLLWLLYTLTTECVQHYSVLAVHPSPSTELLTAECSQHHSVTYTLLRLLYISGCWAYGIVILCVSFFVYCISLVTERACSRRHRGLCLLLRLLCTIDCRGCSRLHSVLSTGLPRSPWQATWPLFCHGKWSAEEEGESLPLIAESVQDA